MVMRTLKGGAREYSGACLWACLPVKGTNRRRGQSGESGIYWHQSVKGP